MADPTPKEKLQPCLLDRLTDDEPEKREEGRDQRVVSAKKYRAGVRRDLEWLFNSSACFRVGGTEELRFKGYREAWFSVINFGTRQLCGLVAPDMDKLQDDIAEAVRFFEPRLASQSLTIRSSSDRNIVSFDVEGEIWANPMPEHLHVKTTVDLETGQCVLGDASNG